MKKIYFNPEAELFELFAADIITDSVDDGDDIFEVDDEYSAQEDTKTDIFTPLSE